MKNNMNELKLYDINDVAAYLKITPRTVYGYIHKGLLKGFKVGNKWRFTDEHIKDFIHLLTKQTDPVDMNKEEEPKRY